MIAVLNYGIGNIQSITRALNSLEIEACATSDLQVIRNADRLILPGVGSFDAAIKKLESFENMKKVLEMEVFTARKPILGICVGMQIMCMSSQEGDKDGLSWIDATVLRIPKKIGRRVPHVGWMKIQNSSDNPLTYNLDQRDFYFSHSYHINGSHEKSVSSLKIDPNIASVMNHDNIWGVQFHPEKSRENGLTLLKNFSEL